jgi:hypothetical protein
MRTFLRVAAALGLALSLRPASSAETRVASIEWQEFGKPNLRAPGAYTAIGKLSRGPSARPGGRLRAVVTIMNEEKQRVEAIEINFAVSAKLKKIGSDEPARWAVPYRVDVRRVPLLAAGQKKPVPIERLGIEPYLRELAVAGYWPVALRIETQVRPRKDMPLSDAAVSELPVEWEAAHARP